MKSFSSDEVLKIWHNYNIPHADTILFLLYTGFRPSEMCGIKVKDVDLVAGTITGGLKTEFGKERIMPIHSKIFELVTMNCRASESGYLFENDGKMWTILCYQAVWSALMKQLKMNHTSHECRHTFRSRLDATVADRKCIEVMMGCTNTLKTIEELKKNIELLKF